MPEDTNRTAFDRLVSGMSLEDRSQMLERINQGTASVVQFVETESQFPEKNLSLPGGMSLKSWSGSKNDQNLYFCRHDGRP